MKKLLLATSLLGFITTNSFAMEGEGDIFRSSLVVDKLERQIRKNKTRFERKYKGILFGCKN